MLLSTTFFNKSVVLFFIAFNGSLFNLAGDIPTYYNRYVIIDVTIITILAFQSHAAAFQVPRGQS
jgi:hypothetical protein